LLNKEIQCPLTIFSLLWPIDTKLAVWEAHTKTQLGIATQVFVIKVNVTVTKNKMQSRLNNFSLLLLFDTKLGVWVAYIKAQLWIATQASMIKVKGTLRKNRNSVSAP